MGNTAVFVGINAIVDPSHKAVVVSGLFLSLSVGMITGVAATSALMLEVMQKHLDNNLMELGLNAAERLDVSLIRGHLLQFSKLSSCTDYIEGRGKRRVHL